jgi:ABC-2 type transport system permease protein
VALVLNDTGYMSDYLRSQLEASTVVRAETLEDPNMEDLQLQVSDGDYGAMMVMPEGYSEAVLRGEPLQLVVQFDNATQEGHVARNEIITVLMRGLSAAETGRISADQMAFEDEGSRRQHVQLVALKALDQWETPPFRVEMHQGGERAEVNAYAQSSPGMMIQFAVIGIMSSASLLMQERKTRAMERMLTTPTRPVAIIIGKLLSGFVMVMVQLAVLATIGQVFYDLPYFGSPLAFILLSSVFALMLSSMGLLIGGFAKTDEAVVILVMIPMFVLSALGGAWFPLETTSAFMQRLGHIVTPTAWAMDAYQDIIVRGLGLQSVLLPAAVITAWGAVMFVLAVRRLRYV